ncbi:type II toxin-antitoxin system RelE/ParE family toxin [Taibaiella lutea]|uniref:Type II toxin-antitoxin system RelE/ParE family toxin n=1 Tax=Taibaiella lutea TaxID=2608001 RepID=A0A5M6CIH7_9BACT|nr:type II toxin-antitoxin system RelE/ParE family toxin [Taibaiella lutea]KAA5534867.1 type II toxin-antitoxin system RelE/ParE family toxin [Taibaiella lutea]
MSYKIIIEDRALQEAQTAYDFYEKKQNGLGDRFKIELEKSITRIEANPKQYKKVSREIRQILLHKFPFVIVYEILQDVIIIYAVFHTSRNPKKKFKE